MANKMSSEQEEVGGHLERFLQEMRQFLPLLETESRQIKDIRVADTGLLTDLKDENMKIKKENEVLKTELRKLQEQTGRENERLKTELRKVQELRERDKEEFSKYEAYHDPTAGVFAEMKEETDLLKRRLQEMDSTNQKLRDDINILTGEKLSLEESNENHVLKIKTLERKVEQTDKQTVDYQQLQNKYKSLRVRLEKTEKELDETKLRLSSMMSHKMSKSNPNIADLSDQNRPTNLAEMFSTLYDDEYTNAFEELDLYYKVEKDRCEKLLELLLDAYKFCARKAEEQLGDLKRECLAGNQMSPSIENTPLVDYSLEEIKEMRKKNAKKSVVSVYKEFVVHMTNAKGSTVFKHQSVFPKTIEYLKKCVELCWLMVLQDPPLVFGPLPQKNDTFDDKLYRSYTRSGSRVDFAVWPVMYLHENGAVLCKGVTEAMDESSRDRYHDKHDKDYRERYVTEVQSEYRDHYDSKSSRIVSAPYYDSHDNVAYLRDRHNDKDDRNIYVADTLDGYHDDKETKSFRPISVPISYGHTNTTRREFTYLFSNMSVGSSDTGDNHHARNRNYQQDIVSPSYGRHYSPRTASRSSSRPQAKAESRKFQAWRY